MHRFIVYQYGKVGSTSIVNTLNKLPEVKAFQAHFLGDLAFSQTLTRLQDPNTPDYFFEHSAGQLFKNLRIYRHYLKRYASPDRLTMLTLAREPFDWFRSGIAQDVQEHLNTFKSMLDKQGTAYSGDAAAVTLGCELMFERLIAVIEHCGSVEAITPKMRPQLRDVIDAADPADFSAFLFLLNTFMRPHMWFKMHFAKVLDTNIRDLEPVSDNLLRQENDWGNTYLIKYEGLEQGFFETMTDLGYKARLNLQKKNLSKDKAYSAELKAAFDGTRAQRLQELCSSEDTRFLGYP